MKFNKEEMKKITQMFQNEFNIITYSVQEKIISGEHIYILHCDTQRDGRKIMIEGLECRLIAFDFPIILIQTEAVKNITENN